MSNLLHLHQNRLAGQFSDHPVRSSATIGGFVVLALAALGALWLMPEITRYIRIRRM